MSGAVLGLKYFVFSGKIDYTVRPGLVRMAEVHVRCPAANTPPPPD